MEISSKNNYQHLHFYRGKRDLNKKKGCPVTDSPLLCFILIYNQNLNLTPNIMLQVEPVLTLSTNLAFSLNADIVEAFN